MNVLEILTGLLPGSLPGASDSPSAPGAAPASEAAFGTVLAASIGTEAGSTSEITGADASNATAADSEVLPSDSKTAPLSALQQQAAIPQWILESGTETTSDVEADTPVDDLEFELRELDESASDPALLLVMPSLAAVLSQPIIKTVEKLRPAGDTVESELITETPTVISEITATPSGASLDVRGIAGEAEVPSTSDSTALGLVPEKADGASPENMLAVTDSAEVVWEDSGAVESHSAPARTQHTRADQTEAGDIPVAEASTSAASQPQPVPLLSRLHSRRHAAQSGHSQLIVIPETLVVNASVEAELTSVTEPSVESEAAAADPLAADLDSLAGPVVETQGDATATRRNAATTRADKTRSTETAVLVDSVPASLATGESSSPSGTDVSDNVATQPVIPQPPVTKTIPTAAAQADVTEAKPVSRRVRADQDEILLPPAGFREWLSGQVIAGPGSPAFPKSLGSQPGFMAIDQRQPSRQPVVGDITYQHQMLGESVPRLQASDLTANINSRALDLTAVNRETTAEKSRANSESVLPGQIGPAAQPVTAPDTSAVSPTQPSTPPPPPPINFSEQLLQAVGVAARDDSTLRIQLAPPELGALQVDVQQQAGEMTARLEVQSRQTHQLVVENLPLLRESLAERGVQLDRVDVVLNEQLAQQSGGFGHGQQQRPETPVDEQTLQRLGRGNRLRSPSLTNVAPTPSVTPARRSVLLRDLDIRI